MFSYERMTSVFDMEYVPCGGMTIQELVLVIQQNIKERDIPSIIKPDTVKAGLLARDKCIVIYNSQNLDYHTFVLVIRSTGKGNFVSFYSAGTALSQHIGGGVLNVDNHVSRVKNVFKSSKQKETEEQEYYTEVMSCVYQALSTLGIQAD